MGSLFDGDLKLLKHNDKTEYKDNTIDIGLIQTKTIGEVIKINDGLSMPKLFTPLTIRGATFQNRIFVSPMCMYACRKQDGAMTDFHLAHYGNLGLRGASLVMIEASSVEACGRLSPQDLGIYSDDHVEPLRRTVNLVHASGSKIGIQIGHGGRKAATYPPYQNFEENGGKLSRDWAIVPKSEGGFSDELVAPSPIAWKPLIFPVPKELSIQEISALVQKFADAASRAVDAGIDVIELHGAHGYLIHEFLSGNTNKRTDKYGGSLENRLRFLLEIITAIRKVIPKEMPLFCRVSGTDQMGDDLLTPDPEGWDIDQVVELCRRAVPLGLDLIDVSSGANLPGKGSPIQDTFGFQVPLAEHVKRANIDGLFVGSVGGLNNGKFSETVLKDNKTDATFVGREFLKNPSYVYTAAEDLGVKVRWGLQYSWMWPL